MAFNRDGFIDWFSEQGFARGGDYVHSLQKLEEHCHWDLNTLLPTGFAAADAQLTQELAEMPTATLEQQRQKTRLRNWRSAFRKYQAYLSAGT
jgi:hypothetical protein